MRKYLFIIALASCMQLSAQISRPKSGLAFFADLCNTGKPLTSYWSNISNLTDNLAKCENADVKILSFEEVGEVKSLKKAAKLAYYNIKHWPHYGLGTACRYSKDADGNMKSEITKVTLHPLSEEALEMFVADAIDASTADERAKATLKNVNSQYLKALASKGRAEGAVMENVKPGYKIFQLEYTINDEKYKEYLFINPDNYQIAPDLAWWFDQDGGAYEKALEKAVMGASF